MPGSPGGCLEVAWDLQFSGNFQESLGSPRQPPGGHRAPSHTPSGTLQTSFGNRQATGDVRAIFRNQPAIFWTIFGHPHAPSCTPPAHFWAAFRQSSHNRLQGIPSDLRTPPNSPTQPPAIPQQSPGNTHQPPRTLQAPFSLKMPLPPPDNLQQPPRDPLRPAALRPSPLHWLGTCAELLRQWSAIFGPLSSVASQSSGHLQAIVSDSHGSAQCKGSPKAPSHTHGQPRWRACLRLHAPPPPRPVP